MSYTLYDTILLLPVLVALCKCNPKVFLLGYPEHLLQLVFTLINRFLCLFANRFISSVSLSILAVDQCQSLCAKPNSRLTNVFSPAFLSKLLWAIAVLLCLPTILYSSKLTLDVPSDTPSSVGWCTVCRLDVSSLVASGSAPGSQSSALSRWLNSLLLVVYLCTLFLIPLLISTVSHGKTYLHLLEHRHRYSHVHDLQKRIRTSDREAIRMLTIVLILYTLTWLPSHLAQILWHTTRPWEPSFSEHTARLWSIILLGSRQVTLLGTSLLPVVYLFFGRSLRENFFNHLYTVLYLCRPSFNGYHLRQSGANRQFSTDSSSSADCKTNSLQKLLSDKDRGGNMT